MSVPESAAARFTIVNHLRHRRLEPEVAAVAADAAVVGESLRVPAEVELVVGLPVAPRAHDQLRLVVAFESGAGNHVEDAVGAVAVLGVVAPPLHVQVVDVLRIELRSDVGGDVRVRHRHPVDEPAHLMASAQVQLIVGRVGPRHERQNRLEAVGPIRARREPHVAPAHEGRRRHRAGERPFTHRGNRHALRDPRDLKGDVEDRTRAGHDGHGLGGGLEPVETDRHGVVARRDRGELELAVRAAGRRLTPVGVNRRERHGCTGDGPMLRVVDDAVDRAGRSRQQGRRQQGQEQGKPAVPCSSWRSCARTHSTIVASEPRMPFSSPPATGRASPQAISSPASA